jgi:prepilin-type N-terminal cleavage/methylation domain-containing protein
MNRTTRKTSAFTLIELLMVIAIIGILAGILIPTVGAVRKQANIAASKSQLSNYVTAIQLFKGEYSYYPFVTGGNDTTVDLSSQSTLFIETLSGRDANGVSLTPAKAKSTGNRRRIGFHSFSESEFMVDNSDDVDPTQLSDRFNNTKLKLRIDGDGTGFITPDVSGSAGPVAPSNPIRSNVTAWVEGSDDVPSYALWD